VEECQARRQLQLSGLLFYLSGCTGRVGHIHGLYKPTTSARQ